MPTFAFVARDQGGTVHTGNLDAADEDQAASVLQNRGLLVTSITQKDLNGISRLSVARSRAGLHSGVTTEDQVLLCQQLATLIESGIPLLKSLEVVSAQVESRRLLLALDHIHRDVQAGLSLRESLAKHPAVFSKLWLNLVGTGESSGHLAQALWQLAKHFESAQRLQTAAKTALTYPAFLMGAILLAVTVFVYWIVPKFSAVFATAHIPLPLLTQIVIGISYFARRYAVLIILAIAGTVYGVRIYLRTEAGRWVFDRAVLRVPLFKKLFQHLQLAEFSQGLSTLLESGVPLLTTLEILEDSATNKVYEKALARIRNAVREGKSISEPMDASPELFPPMIIQMMLVGEEVGELAKMSGRVARYYEDRVETFIARMARLFEPVAIVIMAIVVLFVVLSIYLPIFKLVGGGVV